METYESACVCDLVLAIDLQAKEFVDFGADARHDSAQLLHLDTSRSRIRVHTRLQFVEAIA